MRAEAARWGRGIPVRKRPGKCSDRGVVTQTIHKAMASIARPIASSLALGALVAVLGGCGMSSLTSGIGGGWLGGGGGKSADASVDQDKLLAAAKTETGSVGGGGDVAYGCPRFQVWSRDGYVTVYEQGRVGD